MLYTIQIEDLFTASQEAQPGDVITSISTADGSRYWYVCAEENRGTAAAWMPATDFEETLLNAQLENLSVDEKIKFLIKLNLKKGN